MTTEQKSLNMWIVIFFMCFTNVFHTNAQNITNPESEAAHSSAEVPETLSSRVGRNDNTDNSEDVNSDDDHAFFYSNQWQPFVAAINFNGFNDPRIHQVDGGYAVDHKPLPNFLSQPELDVNGTTKPNSAEKEIPRAPIVFFPHLLNLHEDENKEENNSNVLRDSSNSAPIKDSIVSISNENAKARTPDVQRLYYPIHFRKIQQGFIPSTASIYLPSYPVLPIVTDDTFELINREINSGFKSDISAETAVLDKENRTSDYSHVNKHVLEENISNETSTHIKPLPQPLFRVSGYPFGIVPATTFESSLLPNIFPYRDPTILIPTDPIVETPSKDQAYTPNDQIISHPPTGLIQNSSPFLQLINVETENHAGFAVLPTPVKPTITSSLQLETPSVLLDEADTHMDTMDDTEEIPEEDKSNSVEIPYAFGYDMNDGHGTDQHRQEISDGLGVVTGSYGYRDMFGVYRLVNYIADNGGFRAIVKSNEPGVASSGSADVVVLAERPPPHAIAEGEKATDSKIMPPAEEKGAQVVIATTN